MSKNVKRTLDRAEKLRGWVLLDAKQRLLFRKEAIYRGDFGKLDSSGTGIEFNVVSDTLHHWMQSVRQLRRNGVAIPLSKSHETWDSSEDRLGEVLDASVRANDQGLPSLFLDILFDDEQSRDIALKGDVSIGSPPIWYDGKKREYQYPLQHVASTAAPVIPGLETWQAIAAAFRAAQPIKGQVMELDDLIAMLGIEVPEEANTDEAKIALIKQKLTELVGKPPEEPAQPPATEDVDMSQGDPPVATPAAPAVPQAKKVTVAFSHAPVLVKTVRDSRLAQLDALVTQNIITPAVKQELALAHCSDGGIKLELSNGSSGNEFDSAIKLVKLMAKSKPLARHGRSEAVDDESIIELAHSSNDHSLVKNAEKRAKEFAGAR